MLKNRDYNPLKSHIPYYSLNRPCLMLPFGQGCTNYSIMQRIILVLASLLITSQVFAQKPELIVPSFHSAPLDALRISADGQFMISGGSDQVLKIWDYKKGKEIKNFPTGDDIEEAIFSPDGRYVAATDKAHMYIISLESMKLLHKIKTPYRALVYGIAFHINSNSLYFGYRHDEHKKMEVHQINLDGSNDRLIFSHPAEKYTQNIDALSASPDGRFLLMKTRDHGDFLVNLQNPSNTKNITGGALFFLPNNFLIKYDPSKNAAQFLAADPVSGAVKWRKDFKYLQGSSKYSTHRHFFIDHSTKKLSFSLTNGDNELLIAVDYETGLSKEKRNFLTDKDLVQIAVVGTDWLVLSENDMKIMDANTKAVKKQFGQPILMVARMEGNPTAPALAFGGYFYKGIKQFDFSNGRVKVQSMAVEKGVGLLRASADGRIVAGADVYNYEGNIQVFEEGKLIRKVPIRGKEKKLLDIALSADGATLVIASFEWLRVIDVKSGNVLFEESMQNEYYKYSRSKLTFSTDDKFLLTFEANVDKNRETIHCYSTRSKQLLWAKKAKYGHCYFKNENIVLAQEYSTKKTHTINANTGAIVSSQVISDLVFTVRESPYNLGQQLIAIEDDFNINVYDVRNGNKQATLTGATAQVGDMSFYQQDFLFSCGSDNVVRLWDTRNRVQLAKLIFYETTNDWVIVTPDGRFDGSPNAISQMYYTKGQEFIPLEQLYEQFYTPNLLEQLINREIEPIPVEIEDIYSPPSVKIEYHSGQRNLIVEDDVSEEIIATTIEEAIIKVSAKAPDDRIEEIRLFHNGKLLGGASRNLVVEDDVPSEKEQSFTLMLLPGENTFRAIAINSQRTESAPALLTINYEPKANSSAPVKVNTGLTLHLVVVGINEYKNRKYNLNYAYADAEAFKNAIDKGMKSVTTKVNTHFVSNAEADKSGILNAIETVRKTAQPQDIFVFYYAGHGVMSEGIGNTKKDFYLVPHDVTQLYGADDALAQKGISATEMKDLASAIAAQKQLFVLDACQSAGAVETIAMRGAAEEKAIAQLARSTGTHWLTASGSEQYATEFAQLGHGVFTYALLEGLKGRADSGDKRVTINELKAWLESEVPELTQKYKGTPQYPASYGYGQDFPVSVVE